MIYEAVKLVTAARPNLGFYSRTPAPPWRPRQPSLLSSFFLTYNERLIKVIVLRVFIVGLVVDPIHHNGLVSNSDVTHGAPELALDS